VTDATAGTAEAPLALVADDAAGMRDLVSEVLKQAGFRTVTAARRRRGRVDYSAIGSVCNLAARLCSEAQGGQILIPHRVSALMDGVIDVEAVGELTLKGFHKPAPAYNVVGVKKRTRRVRSAKRSQ
jgi:class 3 adenylate cyclase